VNLETLPGVFGDEGERGMDARAIVDGKPALIFGTGWWGVPNLYFYGVAWMLRLFGDHSMTGDRMLSVVSGVAAVWFAYRIGRLLWGPRAGLLAGGLMAVSPLALVFLPWLPFPVPAAFLMWSGGLATLVWTASAIGLVSVLLRDHLEHCVTESLRSGDPRRARELYDELTTLFARYAR